MLPVASLPLPEPPHPPEFLSAIHTNVQSGAILHNTATNTISVLPAIYDASLTSSTFGKTVKERISFLELLSFVYPEKSTLRDCANVSSQKSDPSLRARDFYKIIDNVSINRIIDSTAPNPDGQYTDTDFKSPTSLRPELRWYQKKTVQWMLAREKGGLRSSSWRLLWLSLAPGLVYNPFFHIAVRSFEDAEKYLPQELARSDKQEVKGGLLAEQMGMGKTVEVLALITANPRDMSGTQPPAAPIKAKEEEEEEEEEEEKEDGNRVCLCGSHKKGGENREEVK
jgi:SNF2 family DNA or RNA helicase